MLLVGCDDTGDCDAVMIHFSRDKGDDRNQCACNVASVLLSPFVFLSARLSFNSLYAYLPNFVFFLLMIFWCLCSVSCDELFYFFRGG